jgi:hypothetical protein
MRSVIVTGAGSVVVDDVNGDAAMAGVAEIDATGGKAVAGTRARREPGRAVPAHAAALPHMLAAFHALLRSWRANGGMDDVLVPG